MSIIRRTKTHGFHVLTTLAFLLYSCTGDCPTRKDVVTLDLNKFTGEWFFLSGTPVNGKDFSKCGRIVVTSTSPDAFVMNVTALRDRETVAYKMSARLDDDVIGYWQPRGSNRILGPFKHRVIDVNYESYSAMIACSGDGNNLSAREFAMIWSRERTLAENILHNLKDKVGSYISRDKIPDADHSNCPQ